MRLCEDADLLSSLGSHHEVCALCFYADEQIGIGGCFPILPVINPIAFVVTFESLFHGPQGGQC